MADTVERSSLLTALIDPLRPTAGAAERPFAFKGGTLAWAGPLGIGLALLVVSAVGWVADAHQFYFSYLVG
jgi:hypothetical protein